MGLTWPLPPAARAMVFSVVCVVLAATAHTSMAPVMLPVTTLAAGFVATAALTRLLATGHQGMAGVGVWTATTQGMLHVLFERTGHAQAAATAVSGATAVAAPGGPGQATAMAGHCGLTAAGVPAATTHGSSLGMLAAHVLAAVACALLLRCGESVVTTVLDLLAALMRAAGLFLFGLLRPLLDGVEPVPGRPAERPPGRPRLLLLAHALVRRGPPVTAFC